MPPLSSIALSSGDLVADRRLELARDYAADGEPAVAAELTEQALELAPEWAAGWFALGEFREAAAKGGGDDVRAGAIAAFAEALRHDPADRCGATLRLARLGARPAPDAPPAAHVRDLFDGYADRYEASLVTALGYRGPALVAAALDAHAAGRRFAHVLDLGCGTGLVAPVIRPRAERLDGVDLAPAMIAKARAGGLYDGLEVGDVVAAMAARPAASLDLLTAGDVFCYLGDLVPVFAAAGRVALPGGLFVFTTEAVGAEEDGDVVLRESLRWAHSRRHLETAATAGGFRVVAIDDAVLRRDRGLDVGGRIAVLAKTDAASVA